MNPRYQLFVFDWDGTLMNSTGIIARCIQDAARDVGLPVPTDYQARFVIGLGIRDTVLHLFPDITEAELQLLAARYRAYFLAREHEAPLFDGIRDMLGALSQTDALLAVATGKARRGLERAFDITGIKHHFVASRCADEGFPKPHPDMLERLLDQTCVEKSAAVMIGDTTHDLELAENAGIDAVAVAYGAHPPELLASRAPKYTADSVRELTEWLLQRA